VFPFNAGSFCKAFSLGNDQFSGETLSILPQKLSRKQENVTLLAIGAGGVTVNVGVLRGTPTELVFLHEEHKSRLQLEVVHFDSRVDDRRGDTSGLR